MCLLRLDSLATDVLFWWWLQQRVDGSRAQLNDLFVTFSHFFPFLLFHTLVKPYILNNLNFAVISVKSIMDILNICKITKRFTFANKLGRETNFSKGFVLGSPAWELYHVLFWWQQRINLSKGQLTDLYVFFVFTFFHFFCLFRVIGMQCSCCGTVLFFGICSGVCSPP